MMRWHQAHMFDGPLMPPPFIGSWKRTPGWGPPQFGLGARWSPYGQGGSGAARWQYGMGNRWSPQSGGSDDLPAIGSLFSAPPPPGPVPAPSLGVLPRVQVPSQDGVPDRMSDPPPAAAGGPPAKKRRWTVLDRVKGLFRRSGHRTSKAVGQTTASALDTALSAFDDRVQSRADRAVAKISGTPSVQKTSRKRPAIKCKSSASASKRRKKKTKGAGVGARALFI